MKPLYADASGGSASARVGHCQAFIPKPPHQPVSGVFLCPPFLLLIPRHHLRKDPIHRVSTKFRLLYVATPFSYWDSLCYELSKTL